MEFPERKNHRLPTESYTSTDCFYFFTICAHNRLPLFADHHLAKSIIDSLLWRHQNNTWNLCCYCLMPDHLHLIISLPEETDQVINAGVRGTIPLGALDQISAFKRYITQIWHKSGGVGPLWQKNSFDSIIDSFDTIDDLIRYVLNNPVRKSLVNNWEDYPYCGTTIL
ncbi:MAG: REP-associated tyrosine transposase [Armatimonadota bacterium]